MNPASAHFISAPQASELRGWGPWPRDLTCALHADRPQRRLLNVNACGRSRVCVPFDTDCAVALSVCEAEVDARFLGYY